MNDKVQVDGLTFDTAALDALLDDTAPPIEKLPDEPAPEDDAVEDDTVGEESGEEVREDDVSEPEADTEETPDGGDDDTPPDDKDSPEIEADFIVNGDEGPQLLTDIDEKGNPVYETAAQLFGDHQFKIKAAGEEVEVTFDEMRKGYQRHADYTKAKTSIAETQRAMQPYVALLTLYEKDEGFKHTINNYIEGVKEEEITNEDIVKASEEPEKLKTLLAKRDKQNARKKAMNAANTAAAQQQQQFARQQYEIATNLIPNYNETVQDVKTFLGNLGYGDHEVNGFEYLDARLQNMAYLAYKAANPDSNKKTSQKPGKRVLQSKKRIVRRPPKSVTATAGQSNTPKARSNRKAKAAFQKAYKTRKDTDMVDAIASVLPDDLLDD